MLSPKQNVGSLTQGVSVALLMIGFVVVQGAVAQAIWHPNHNIEIVIGSAPGSSQDKTGRTMQRILQDHRLVDTTVSVLNKPGGGSAIGWTYLSRHGGDGHFLAVSSPLLLTNHITGSSPLKYTDIAPVAQLLNQYTVFVVKADSPIKTGADLIKRLREDPTSVIVGVSGNQGNALHIAFAAVGKAAGIDVRKLKIVIFKGGGLVMTALLGGHVEIVPTSPSNAVPFVKSGALRAIAVSAPHRLGGPLASVPTWKELGVDAVVVSNWRGLIGPLGLTTKQTAFWDGVFAKVVQTAEWKKDLERNLWEPNYLSGAESAEYLRAQNADLTAILIALGLAKM